nr:uncharacterized protein LOC111506754 [Leptinotarsa decemlineata]
MGEDISDVAVISKIINSFPPKFAMLVTAWDSVDSSKQTLSDIIARLLREEHKLSVSDNKDDSLALQIQSMKIRHNPKNSTRKRKMRMLQAVSEHSKEVLICDLPTDIEDWVEKEENEEDIWLADTGASAHMSFRKEWFHNLKTVSDEISVRIADIKLIKVTAVGDINVKANINGIWKDKVIVDVLFIPKLRRNLLSVGKITDKDFVMTAQRDRCEFCNAAGELFCVGLRRGNSLKLWHEKMGHVNLMYVRDTIYSGAVEGASLEDESDFFCEGCKFGKQNRRNKWIEFFELKDKEKQDKINSNRTERRKGGEKREKRSKNKQQKNQRN